jgi:hypothetical protein
MMYEAKAARANRVHLERVGIKDHALVAIADDVLHS